MGKEVIGGGLPGAIDDRDEWRQTERESEKSVLAATLDVDYDDDEHESDITPAF